LITRTGFSLIYQTLAAPAFYFYAAPFIPLLFFETFYLAVIEFDAGFVFWLRECSRNLFIVDRSAPACPSIKTTSGAPTENAPSLAGMSNRFLCLSGAFREHSICYGVARFEEVLLKQRYFPAVSLRLQRRSEVIFPPSPGEYT